MMEGRKKKQHYISDSENYMKIKFNLSATIVLS